VIKTKGKLQLFDDDDVMVYEAVDTVQLSEMINEDLKL